MKSLFIDLLQVAIGNRNTLSRTPSAKEWKELYDESVRQAVAGVCLAGVDKLTVKDPKVLSNISFELKIEWIALTERIRLRNRYIDKQTAEMWKRLKDDGLDTAILKGQGIASMYDIRCMASDGKYERLSELRQSGDIDIWVKGGYQIVCDYVQRTYPTEDVAYHRFHYDIFPDTEVELHHRPTLMRNLFDDRKLARWYNAFDADSFVYLDDKGFAVPPADFNVIFILTHIYRHFLFEGIGLRQVMDYYFVLKAQNNEKCKMEEIRDTLRNLRLERFAGAMMWVLREVFGLEKEKMICTMHEKEGQFVLDEILQTGNFGQGDTRYKYKRWFKLRHHIAHGSHLIFHYPSEVIWTPVWLVYHKVWKWNKKRKIRKSRK